MPFNHYLHCSELGQDEGNKESGSSLSFKALQSRIEGVQFNKKEIVPQMNTSTQPTMSRSFDNPLFGATSNVKEASSPSRAAGTQNQLEPNLLNPIHKSSSNPSIKSNKSTKSFKSLLGLNKDTITENPMVDLSIDIGMEASKFDPFDFQVPLENKVDEPIDIEGSMKI